MLSHTGTLWHYLVSFIGYTLLAIGMIYGTFLYIRKFTGRTPLSAPANDSVPDEAVTVSTLALETSLALEPDKNLYIVRSLQERFLVATSSEGVQLISKLESVSPPKEDAPEVDLPVVASAIEKPWYAEIPKAPVLPQAPPVSSGFGARFLKSVQWVVSSRASRPRR